MRKIMIIMIVQTILMISMPTWALKPLEDDELSAVSGPDSLTVSPHPAARLVLREPRRDGLTGIGPALMSAMEALGYEILYGDEADIGNIEDRLKSANRMAYSRQRDYRERFINNEEFESDQAYGKDDLDINLSTDMDSRYYLTESVQDRHSIYYLLGSSASSSNSIYVTVKPYGGPELRDYYTSPFSTNIEARSWVDVNIR